MGYLETLEFGGDEQGLFINCNRCKSPIFYGFNPMSFDEMMDHIYDHRCVTFKPTPVLSENDYRYYYSSLELTGTYHTDLLKLLARP